MLAATLLALGAAVLHAGWNLAVKQSGDRFIALWGQFFAAGVICAVVLVGVGGIPAAGWAWAAVSGLVHVPYTWFLARAYDHGDFSLVYPVARGGGALLAAIGGIVLLGDGLSGVAVPVRGPHGEVVAALGISGPTARLEGRLDELGRILSSQAEQLTGLLRGDTTQLNRTEEGVA